MAEQNGQRYLLMFKIQEAGLSGLYKVPPKPRGEDKHLHRKKDEGMTRWFKLEETQRDA